MQIINVLRYCPQKPRRRFPVRQCIVGRIRQKRGKSRPCDKISGPIAASEAFTVHKLTIFNWFMFACSKSAHIFRSKVNRKMILKNIQTIIYTRKIFKKKNVKDLCSSKMIFKLVQFFFSKNMRLYINF